PARRGGGGAPGRGGGGGPAERRGRGPPRGGGPPRGERGGGSRASGGPRPPQARLPRQARLRVSSACLTSAIAFVTWMPRGHASVQLNVVRQRHTPSRSLRTSRRMSPPSSRLSKMKRWAFTIDAGPKYWPSVQ